MTTDGCPVELWSALPAGDIPAILNAALPPNATVLDLGAGAGRLTHPLAAAGHHVTAIDESEEMLSCIHQGETVCSTIEDLRLDQTFDAVLLASHLVNVPDRAMRDQLLATCRHHVTTNGVVLIQRYTSQWAQQAPGTTALGAGILSELTVKPQPSTEGTHMSVVATYTLGSQRWEQTYVTCVLDDDDLSKDLERAGLRLDRWLDDDGSWVIARPKY